MKPGAFTPYCCTRTVATNGLKAEAVQWDRSYPNAQDVRRILAGNFSVHVERYINRAESGVDDENTVREENGRRAICPQSLPTSHAFIGPPNNTRNMPIVH